MAASTDGLVEIILDIDLTLEPECQSALHESDPYTHGGPTTHWMVVPCGHNGLRCAEKVRDITADHYLTVACCYCGADFDSSDFTFIEL